MKPRFSKVAELCFGLLRVEWRDISSERLMTSDSLVLARHAAQFILAVDCSVGSLHNDSIFARFCYSRYT